jgi:ABC-2 type transport system ATP-binding protein
MDTVIEIEHLTKRYGSLTAVDDVSFEVGRGEILGPNGAGKTTTVECLEGLRDRDAGSVRVLGLDPQHQGNDLRRRIGTQLQESALPDRMRVWEALDLFASIAPEGPDWRLLMEQWGLAGKRGGAFSSLSGGQRQRLLVALALLNDPEVVFLDEMTTGLDPAARRIAWDLIRAIRERGTTIVLVTHFMDEAERLCDRIGVMVGGHLSAVGTPQGLVNAHAPEVRLTFTTDAEDLSWLREVTCVRKVERWGGHVEVEGIDPVIALVSAALVSHGITPSELRVAQPNLEDVFLRLTGETPE